MNFAKQFLHDPIFLIGALFCLWTLPAAAQLQPEDKFLEDAIFNSSTYSVDFNLADGTDNGVSSYDWSARIIESTGTTPLTGRADISTNLRLNLNQVDGRVSVNGTISNFVGSVVRFTVTVTMTNGTTVTDQFWMAIRAAALPDQGSYKIALMLDASGSMNSTATGTSTRWDILQDRLRSYIPSLKNWVDPGDQLQVIHFQGSGGPVSYNNTVNFSSISATDPSANDNILFGTTNAGGGTPLGAGIDVLPAFAADRHAIITFTDGYENGCPLALPNIGMNCPNPPTITLPNTTYFPIGFQGTNEQLLADLAAQNTQGQSAFALDPDDLDQLFLRTIPELFSGSTPRIVVFKTEQLSANDFPGQVVETFRVDSLVRKLTLSLKCRSGNCRFGEDVSLRLGNTSLPFPEFYSDSEIRYAIDLPYSPPSNLQRLDGGGTWTLSCSANAGSEYDLMVIVDDKYLSVETNINGGQPVYAGDAINVRTEAAFVGEAFNGLTAEAFLLRPGEDPGRLFAETKIDPPAPRESTLGPGLSQSSLLAQAKIDALLARPDILERFRKQNRNIPLTRTADGRYTGTFTPSESEVSSHYTVVVKYTGFQPGLDSIQGMTMDHFLVRFGRPEDIRLNPVIQYVAPLPGQDAVGGYRVQVRPVNRFGNPLGPAQAQNIRVQVNGEFLVLEDQLDGTYSAFARNAPQRSQVEVFVLDGERPVIKRQLGAWGLSLHGGTVMPSNTSAPFNTLSSGTYFEGDITYRFNQHWEVELLVGQNQFSNNFNLLEISAYGSYRFTQFQIANLLTPYLKAGAGYFKPDGIGGGLGLGLRGGVNLPIGQHLNVFGEYSVGYVVDPDLLFSKVGAGLKYFF